MLKNALLGASALALSLSANVAMADTSGKRIALSNNYAGNCWRQAMLKSWEKVTGAAVADGPLSRGAAFTTAENQVTEQAAQIQNLILQGYDAIVINAASPDALNGVVKQACDAGIVVVSFDGIVTEPCAYRIAVDFAQPWARFSSTIWPDACRTAAILLEIRGLAGVFVDDEIQRGIHEGVAENPTSSRSSDRSMATGRRTWRRRPLPVFCRLCRKSPPS